MRYYLLITYGLFPLFLAAQTGVGVRAGLNYASMSFVNDSLATGAFQEQKTGYHAGLFADIHLGPHWYLSPSLLFSLKGVRLRRDTLSQTDINLQYLQVPLCLGIRKQLGIINFFVQTGPYAGYGFAGNVKVSSLNAAFQEVKNDLFEDQQGLKAYEKTDWGWNVAAGIGIKKLHIMAAYDIGLKDANASNTGSAKNRVLQVSLGYKF